MDDCTSLIGDLLQRVPDNNIQQTLKDMYAKDPHLFDMDNVNIQHALYKTSIITFENFEQLAKLATIVTFNEYLTTKNDHTKTQLEYYLTCYYNALGSKFVINPNKFRDRILSLLSLKIHVTDTSTTNHIAKAKIEYRNIGDARNGNIANAVDVIYNYNYIKNNFQNAVIEKISLQTSAVKINVEGPIITNLVNNMINYQENVLATAFNLNKKIKPFIKDATLDNSKLIIKQDESDSD